jgi:hypothetical protein
LYTLTLQSENKKALRAIVNLAKLMGIKVTKIKAETKEKKPKKRKKK